MRIAPFDPLRPPLEYVSEVSCPPYDVVNTQEARKIGQKYSRSFIQVTRPEIALADSADPYAPEVYQLAAEKFARMQEEGNFMRHGRRSLFLYRQRMGNHSQTGLMCCCHVEEYESDIIKKHEKTRKDKEDDRTRHTLAIRAHAGPVFLTFRDVASIDRMILDGTARQPLYDFTADDGVTHTVWEIADSEPWLSAFEHVPVAYVADGHHRSASAARTAAELRRNNPDHTGYEEYNWFLAVLFPAGALKIMPYNRVVKSLNGLSPATFLDRVRQVFHVRDGQPTPQGTGFVSMFLEQRWYSLELPRLAKAHPVDSLDVSILQDKLLAPVLGIDDPRTSNNIDFVGGIHGPERLEALVRSGKGQVAFSMAPVTLDQLMDIADAGGIMPPKSTWFEPKLRSGILVHTF